MKRKSSTAVAITITALLSSGLVACSDESEEQTDYAKVCRDASSGNRLPDADCEENDRTHHAGHVGWYFLPLGSSGRSIPPVGSSVNAPDGVTSVPAGKSASSGVDARGGSVTRGGFGGAKAGS